MHAPGCRFGFLSGLPMLYESSLKSMSSTLVVSTISDEETGCTTKLAPDVFHGPHVDGSQ